MDEPTQERRCSVCGGPIQQRNAYGICRRRPECNRERSEVRRRRLGVPARGTSRKPCRKEGCPNLRSVRGYCGMHYERMRRTGDPGPAGKIYRADGVSPGDVFFGWTALESSEEGRQRILCRCACGTERHVAVGNLLKGNTRSCGCLRAGKARRLPVRRGPYLPAGSVHARLITLEDAEYALDLVRVKCECGTETKARASALRAGNTRSCGCLHREAVQTHGLSGHPLYGIWHGIYRRTSVPTERTYPSYGGRGIKMAMRWQGMPEGFLNFVADVGERPPNTTLDRINNDGDYEPGNVRWATQDIQARNQRRVDPLTRERDALRAQVEELTRLLAAQSQSRHSRATRPVQPDALF